MALDQEQPTDTSEATMRRDGYMTPTEAAENLGCSKRWLLDGLNKHGFPHTKMGRAKLLSPEDREQIRKLCRVPAEPAKIAVFRRSRRRGRTPRRRA